MDLQTILANVEIILAGLSFSKEALQYIGLQDSLDVKIDKLTNSELNAGINAVKQASSSDNEKITLLREARSRFNKAIALEKNENLAFAYLGLAFCHLNLGDKTNCTNALKCIDQVEIEQPLPIFRTAKLIKRQREKPNPKNSYVYR
jgi:hypothetical protein